MEKDKKPCWQKRQEQVVESLLSGREISIDNMELYSIVAHDPHGSQISPELADKILQIDELIEKLGNGYLQGRHPCFIKPEFKEQHVTSKVEVLISKLKKIRGTVNFERGYDVTIPDKLADRMRQQPLLKSLVSPENRNLPQSSYRRSCRGLTGTVIETPTSFRNNAPDWLLNIIDGKKNE